ncbi:MAG: DedA family protein [Bauldia sp.]|nr:DedA family protein [Bauldia sp.]
MNDVIQQFIENAGVFGVAALMFIENVFPPLPSEVIMPLAGYAAARGDLPIVPIVLAGAFGSLAGATIYFIIAKWFGEARLRRWADRFGRVFTLTQTDIDRADDWFRRRGYVAVLLGRLVPAIRSVISIPAGLAGMRWGTFLFYSFIGSLVWSAALMLAGYWLGSRSGIVGDLMGPITIAIVVVCVAVYAWRFLTYPRRKAREEAERASHPAAPARN